MDPAYSVLIYSKYSANCKKAFDLMRNSGVDFTSLQLLCIDNEKVRQRIKQNKQIEVESVPCVLSVFSNGNVEKYDGANVFNWIENIIIRFAPPPLPPQPPSQPPMPPQQRRVRIVEPEQEAEQEAEPEPEEERPIRRPAKQQSRSKIPPRMKPIQQQEEVQGTPISEVPMEDEPETDRHRNIPQPRRIKHDDSGQFIEDEELFGGEVVDYRRNPVNTVKNTTQRAAPDPFGTRAKAEEMARGRDAVEAEINNRQKRSIPEMRRP